MNVEAARGLNPILKGRYSSVYTKFTFFNHQSELDLTIDNEGSSGVYSSPPFPLTSVNLLRLDYQVTLTQVVKICLSAVDLRIYFHQPNVGDSRIRSVSCKFGTRG